jgi:cytochrome oxidase Cu insertion factor (SCO1/SenC/PrrC family)
VSDTEAMRRALALLCLATLTACGSSNGSTLAQSTPTPDTYHGVEPQPVLPRPEFVLTDTNGKAFDFQQQTGGRPTLLYFGYTHCPDECPTAMADIASALRMASPAVRSKVLVVFITTDVRRDTAPVLRRWLDQFSTQFIGLLGTQAQVNQAQQAAGVAPAYPDGVVPTIAGHPDEHVHKPGTAPHKHFGPLGYAVAHTAAIFAYDAADRLPVLYPGGVTPADIAADLPVLANP